MAYLNGQKILLGSNVVTAKLPIDQNYSPESENAQSGKAVAQAVANLGGTDETYDLIETVSVTETAVVQRIYDKYYKKILVWAHSDAKLPRFRLINSINDLFWEFYSYAANTYDCLKLYGACEVNLSMNEAVFDVKTVVGNKGNNSVLCLPVTERLGPCTVYNYGFNGFKTDGVCNAGTTIKIYGVKA